MQIMTSWFFLMQLMPCDCTRGPEKHQAAIGVIWIGAGMLIVMKAKQARAGWSASHTKDLFTIGSVKKNFPQAEKFLMFLLLKIW